jgi:(2Fe-2S) ferredoxin
MKIRSVKDLEKISSEFSQRLYFPESVMINVGMASCGIAAGAKATFEKALKEYSAGPSYQVRQTGCLGFCEEEPLVEMVSKGRPRIVYKRVTENRIADVVQDYMEEKYSKKLILGQMKDPRSRLAV